MKRRKEFISYRAQSYLAFIPYFGFAIVMLTSFYNIYKVKNLLYIGLYFLSTLVPIAFFFAAVLVLDQCFLLGKDPTVRIVVNLLMLFVILLCLAAVCLAIEKAMIRKLGA